jgi:histidinol-phosphate phosphatase family protein
VKLTAIDITRYETLFLDRDGVINRHRPNDYVKCWEEFEFLPDILETLAKWSRQVRHIFIITNQRGVGKGLMSENDLKKIHLNMLDEINRHGGRIDKIYYCTAISDDDINRKPNTGLAIQAKQDFPDINFGKSVMIGDSECDRFFAKNAGMEAILINKY